VLKSDKAWWAVISLYVALLAFLLIGTYSGAPETVKADDDIAGATLMFWLLKSLPLFLFIPGLLKKSHYAASWLSYVTMLYFVVIIAMGAGIWMWAQVSALILLFVACMLFTRWKKAEEQA
jgi:uncharacterized membrane protein